MSRNQTVGILWVIVAIVYGVGSGIIQERWFSVGGAMFFALFAVTSPIWRQWIPDNPEN